MGNSAVITPIEEGINMNGLLMNPCKALIGFLHGFSKLRRILQITDTTYCAKWTLFAQEVAAFIG